MTYILLVLGKFNLYPTAWPNTGPSSVPDSYSVQSPPQYPTGLANFGHYTTLLTEDLDKQTNKEVHLPFTMKKAAVHLAKAASSASPRCIVGSILPVVPRQAVARGSSPSTAQWTSRQVSTGSKPQPAFPKPPKQAMSPATLEVERKFAPTPISIQQLATNAGTPPFASLIRQGTTNLEDAYYDTADEALCKAGVWLRRRGDKWEAKIRVGGDFTNSAFEEVTNVKDISAMLARLVPGAALDPHDGLMGGRIEEVAMLVSERNKFLVDEKFTVVLDKTDFGHVVGEVELERAVSAAGEKDDAGDQSEHRKRAQMIAEMDQEIDEFMKQYVWAFPPGRPVGKLSAYFALKQRQ